MTKKRAILFMAWGEKCIAEMYECIKESHLPGYPIYLITDHETKVDTMDGRINVTRVTLELDAKARKCEMGKYLPRGYDSILFLDVDTRILNDITFGFEKAELHGIAIAQAAHYSLPHFKDFSKIMQLENIKPESQLLYNSGVIFFSLNTDIQRVFDLWTELGFKYPDAPWGDQTYLTLALEILQINPYTLSTAYNHRAFGEWISGDIRIWHSYKPVPDNINDYEKVFPRCYSAGRIIETKIQ